MFIVLINDQLLKYKFTLFFDTCKKMLFFLMANY